MKKPTPPQSRSTRNDNPETYSTIIGNRIIQKAKSSGKSLKEIAKALEKISL